MYPLRKNNLSLNYKSEIKEKINISAYTGREMKPKDKSIEHIQPHSKGGKNSETNYLIVEKHINQKRGNLPFHLWLEKMPKTAEKIQNYLDFYRGKIILNKTKEDYVESVIPKLNEQAKGVVVFKNKLNFTV